MANLFKRILRGRESGLDLSKATPAELAYLSRMPSSTKERNFIETRLGVPLHRFADYNSYLEVGCKRVWASYRACKLISAVIVSATYKMQMGDDDESERVTSSGEFLRKPNPYDSWEELIEMWVFHMELTGSAFWLKDEVDLLGRPLHLYPLLPQYMRIVPDATDKVAKYIYKVNGTEVEFAPEEIIHFRCPHPMSLHWGLGSVESSESLFSGFINRNVLEEKFMENGAQVSGILVRDSETDVDPEQWQALKKKFNLEYAGKRNAGKTAFLNGKWAYHKLGMTMAEMQSMEQEKWGVEQIFLNHGVPLSVAGIQGAANYATAKQDEINFRRYKVVPLIDTLVGKLNSDGFFRGNAPTTLELIYELSGLVDVEQIVREYGPLVDMGAMTRNEIREMCGLGEIDNPLLDQFMLQANVVPIEMAGFSDPVAMLESEEKAFTRRKRRALAMRED
jgi:HK97 family phage portal protein